MIWCPFEEIASAYSHAVSQHFLHVEGKVLFFFPARSVVQFMFQRVFFKIFLKKFILFFNTYKLC
jgi:hypothetical protein